MTKALSLIEQKCIEKGMKITGQRKLIAQILSESKDHPDADELYRRVAAVDNKVSIPTIYRTLRLLEAAEIIRKVDFSNGRARYEYADNDHHHHLIDIQTGEIIEFYNEELEKLKHKIASDLGYELIDHKLELYGTPINKKE